MNSPMCANCQDSGLSPASDYLDCTHCHAATILARRDANAEHRAKMAADPAYEAAYWTGISESVRQAGPSMGRGRRRADFDAPMHVGK